MVEFKDAIDEGTNEWIMKQKIFYVASAPLKGRHVNLSPKGLPGASFAILSPNLVAYADATGSGIETVANLRENGRCTIMMCSYDADPLILRLFCHGRSIEFDHPDFEPWLERLGCKGLVGQRAVIVLDVYSVQTSCGYGVPQLALEADKPVLVDRPTMDKWSAFQIRKKTLDSFRTEYNARSIDGLPGLRSARIAAGERIWLADLWTQAKSAMPFAASNLIAFLLGVSLTATYLTSSATRSVLGI